MYSNIKYNSNLYIYDFEKSYIGIWILIIIYKLLIYWFFLIFQNGSKEVEES